MRPSLDLSQIHLCHVDTWTCTHVDMCTCIIQIMAVAVCCEDLIIFSRQILGSLGISGCPSCGNVKVYRTEMVVYCTVLYCTVYCTGVQDGDGGQRHLLRRGRDPAPRSRGRGQRPVGGEVPRQGDGHRESCQCSQVHMMIFLLVFNLLWTVEFVKRRKYFQVFRHLAERFRNIYKFSTGSLDSPKFGE